MSAALREVELVVSDFRAVTDRAQTGDLISFDPPYGPIRATASFTNYTGHGFGESEQRALAEVFGTLVAKGCSVVLSNSDHPLVRELYQPRYPSMIVLATRPINCQVNQRGVVNERVMGSHALSERKSREMNHELS